MGCIRGNWRIMLGSLLGFIVIGGTGLCEGLFISGFNALIFIEFYLKWFMKS